MDGVFTHLDSLRAEMVTPPAHGSAWLSCTHTRATTVAFALLVMNLLGVGPGPLITGMIGDARGLTTALLVSLGVVALAIVPFALAARRRAAA
jgi:hypothetical protein